MNPDGTSTDVHFFNHVSTKRFHLGHHGSKLASMIFSLLVCGSSLAAAEQSIRDCETCPELVRIPAGSFIMGSPESEKERSSDESPMHQVTFGAAFAIGKYEITHAQFESFVKETARQMQNCFWDPVFPRSAEHPALCLTAQDAEAYTDWLSVKTGHKYRLPTEAEWEYVIRGASEASTYTVYSFGDDPAGLCQNANTRVKGCNDGFGDTAPVGSFPPNSLGVYDLHGNVWEFTADCVTTSYETAPPDGTAVRMGDCSKRIIRGGAWYNASAGHFRSANRGWLGTTMADVMNGFRVVRECGSPSGC